MAKEWNSISLEEADMEVFSIFEEVEENGYLPPNPGLSDINKILQDLPMPWVRYCVETVYKDFIFKKLKEKKENAI